MSKDVVYKILDKIIQEVELRLKDRNITIKLTPSARDYIINSSYDENFGARPIKRFVSDNVETMIAMDIVLDKIKNNSNITIDYQDNKLLCKY